MSAVAHDARRLAAASCFMESDIHCSPTQLIEAVRRYNSNFPESYFQVTDDSRHIVDEMAKTYREFLDANPKQKIGRSSEVAFLDYAMERSSFQEDLM
jgi:hypothetical protein